MNLSFLFVLTNLAGLFIIAAIGYVFTKAGVFDRSHVSIFSALLLKLALPCTIFTSLVSGEYDPKFIHDSLIIISIGMIAFPVLLIFSEFIAKFMGVPVGSRGTWAFCSTFSNSGFIGFPIALRLFGAEGLLLAVMFNIAFNIYIYTMGAIVISHDSTEKHEHMNLKSILFSNINLALILSLVFYFGRIPVHEIIMTPLKYLSDITTPLSMVIIGIALGISSGKDFLTDINAWTSNLMRLVIYPVATCFILKLLPIDNILISAVVVVIMAMPVAGVSSTMAEIYHGDLSLVAKITFISNIACIITIPLVCMLIG